LANTKIKCPSLSHICKKPFPYSNSKEAQVDTIEILEKYNFSNDDRMIKALGYSRKDPPLDKVVTF